jgi:hypothetical protein
MNTKSGLSLASLTLVTLLLSPGARSAVFLANPIVDNGKIEISVKVDDTPQFAEAMDFFLSFDQAHFTLSLPVLGPNYSPPDFSVLPFEGPQHVGFSCITFDPCPLQSAHDDVLLTWTLTPKAGFSGDPHVTAMLSRFGVQPDGTFIDSTPTNIPSVPEPATASLFLVGFAGLVWAARQRRN